MRRLLLLRALLLGIASLARGGLVHLPNGSSVQSFVTEHVEPSGAVAVFFLRGIGGSGTGSATLTVPAVAEKLASRADLADLLGGWAVVPLEQEGRRILDQYSVGEGVSRLCIFYRGIPRSGGGLLDPPVWRELGTGTDFAEEPLAKWILEHSYPLVNVPISGVFAGPKYVQSNPLGLVLVLSEHLRGAVAGEESARIDLLNVVEALRPWAKLHRRRLKFSIFSCERSTAQVCLRLGLAGFGRDPASSPRLVIVEDLSGMAQELSLVGRAPSAKYVLEGAVEPNTLRRFFERYEAGKLRPYFVSLPAARGDISVQGRLEGVCQLSGADLDGFLDGSYEEPAEGGKCGDGAGGALVLFWLSRGSSLATEEARHEVQHALVQLEQLARQPGARSFARLGAVDCGRHEHGHTVPALPWFRWFPRQSAEQKRGGAGDGIGAFVDVHARTAEGLSDFLENARMDLEEEL